MTDSSDLAIAFNEAIIARSVGDTASLNEVLLAASTVAAAYLQCVEDHAARFEKTEEFVGMVRAAAEIKHNRSDCIGCAILEAINRKHPDGMDGTAASDILEHLADVAGQVLAQGTDRAADIFARLTLARRDRYRASGETAHAVH